MKISVLVPTYKRVEKLRKCLDALALQSLTPYEVIVIYRDEDTQTRDLLHIFQERLPLKIFCINLPGVIHAENLAIEKASGDLLSFIDDDGYAPTNWCEKISMAFSNDPTLIALGGPDNIIGDEKYRKDVNRFGYITWYGKLIGNHHHRGVGIHDVEVLKGVNMTVKREDMPKLDPLLSSDMFKGNGCHWELDIFLTIKNKHPHPKIQFDTSLEVQHESQHSKVIILDNLRNNARNLIYIYLKQLNIYNNLIHIIYLLILGHSQIPGILKILHFCIQRENQILPKTISAWQGVWQGFMLYYKREKS